MRLIPGIRECSIGDFVIAGGEAAALVLTEAVVRLIPGVVGDAESVVNETFEKGRVEYPQYTRPPAYRGMQVPEVLLSGDHAKVAAWRGAEALRRTRERRPDLLRGGAAGETECGGPARPARRKGRTGGKTGGA